MGLSQFQCGLLQNDFANFAGPVILQSKLQFALCAHSWKTQVSCLDHTVPSFAENWFNNADTGGTATGRWFSSMATSTKRPCAQSLRSPDSRFSATSSTLTVIEL